jgi:hypothetical protein
MEAAFPVEIRVDDFSADPLAVHVRATGDELSQYL